MSDLNWVKALDEAHPQKEFARLIEAVRKDVKQRNTQLAEEGSQFKYGDAYPFIVYRQMHPQKTISFYPPNKERMSPITVLEEPYDENAPKKELTLLYSLGPDGIGHYTIEGQGGAYSQWQIRRRLLEDFLFS